MQRILFSRAVLCAALLAWAVAPAHCCLNSQDGPMRPRPSKPKDYVEQLTKRASRADWQRALENATTKHLGAQDWSARNSEAVALAHLGDYEKSFEILQTIEAQRPGEYRIAANLGTLCELRGDNEAALRWIQEGIRRDPHSHQGSEWLHVRILEAKIASAEDRQWLQTHAVSGLDCGGGDAPTAPTQLPHGNSGMTQTPAQVESSLQYQLHERLEFTPRRDPIVADLLFDYANLIALRAGAEAARGVYQLSWSYGPTHTALVKRRLEASGGSAGLPAWLKLLAFGGVIALGIMRFGAKKRS